MLFTKLKQSVKPLYDWEQWSFHIFYFPISYAWLLYYVKSRSLWFFTASNPTLSFGGFEGTGKSEMYKHLPSKFCAKSIFISPSCSFTEVVEKVKQEQLDFPLVVKPDIGMKGLLFRKVETVEQLKQYHHRVPAIYIIQEYVNMPLEVSVFYCRMPDDEKGEITAVIQKHLPEITGDGNSTLEQLINEYSNEDWIETVKKFHENKLKHVLKKDEKFCLSHVANLMNGAKFKNISNMINEKLVMIFDNISHKTGFYYGRYDIKCASLEDLYKENFIILEFNGAGSVPNHIYTGGYTLLSAYREILKHWSAMF